MKNCEWVWEDKAGFPCHRYAETLMIFGCLNQHINEMTVCPFHQGLWAECRTNHHIYCPNCEHPVDYHGELPINNLWAYTQPLNNLIAVIK